MKGEEVPAFTQWQGNPAAETREPMLARPAPKLPFLTHSPPC
jgi:hypothetical protein